MDIRPGDFDDDRVKALLRRHLEDMHANSPAGHVFALDWSGLQMQDITFYAMWEGEELLGVGALKELDARAGEIKSMRTANAHLRRGVASRILEHIIAEAGRRGYARLSLETGSGASFEPALALYRKRGFVNGSAFGDYEPSEFNQFLHLDLGSAPAIPRIRRAVADDAPGIVAVLEAVASERVHSAIDRVWTVEEERRYLDSLSPRETIHVAVDETGHIVGLQILDRWSSSLSSMAHVGQVGTFLLQPWRRRGVGRLLWNATRAFARDSGYSKLVIQVRASNAAARAFYETLGFREGGRLTRQVIIDGVEDDELLMELFV